MARYIRSRMTFIVAAAIIVILVPAACGSPVPNISQVEQTAKTMDPEDCSWDQFLNTNGTCENCAFCTQGTEHSPNEQCGNGLGTKTTCTPCAEGFFQTGEGYTGLVCSPCVVCYPNLKSLQNCTPTQDARCGPCPPGKYEFQPNICLECEHDPSHPDCPQPIIIKPSTASSNQSAPTPSSLITLPESTTPDNSTPSPLSSPARNTSIDHDEEGTPIKKFSVLGITAIVIVIIICVILLACLAYKKWKATNNSASEDVLHSKSPDAFPNAAYGGLPKDDSMTHTDDGGSSVGSSQSEIQCEIAEESAALAPGAETTSATPSIEQLQGASNPVDQSSALLTSDVTNIELSLPGELSSNEGAGNDAWYQNHPNHAHRSPEDKDSLVFEDEDGSMSHPKSLKSLLSKSLLSD